MQNNATAKSGSRRKTSDQPPQRPLTSTARTRDEARRVKSTGCDGVGIVNVAVTGANVPNWKLGIVTFALLAETTVNA